MKLLSRHSCWRFVKFRTTKRRSAQNQNFRIICWEACCDWMLPVNVITGVVAVLWHRCFGVKMAEREALKREIEELQSKCDCFIYMAIFYRKSTVVLSLFQKSTFVISHIYLENYVTLISNVNSVAALTVNLFTKAKIFTYFKMFNVICL